MIKPGEIQQIANRLNLRDTQIEKDYVIGWILRGIAENDYLKQRLVFKGGTVLRKAYFRDNRLSEDLDFTYIGDDYIPDQIKQNFQILIEWLQEEVRINISIEDDQVYQTGNYNFYLSYVGSLGGKGANKSIKTDIANDELLCDDPIERVIFNEYSDLDINFQIQCYTLGEIITEKMRSLMQRTMPRDVYDLWYLFEREQKDIENYIYNFRKKAEFKALDPTIFVKTVDEKKSVFERQWNQHLVDQIQEVPDFNDVWRRLGKHWRKFDSAL